MNQLMSFVILTWNSERTINDCLISLSGKCGQENIRYEIFMVDNGSSDKTVDIIQNDFQNLPINLIKLKKNLGTTTSRNIALKKCRGDIVCILDSDTIFQNGKLSEIISFLEDKSIGIVAPKLILQNGTVQNSVKKFPSCLSKVMKIPRILFNVKTKDYDFYDEFPFSSGTKVDTAISACWFLKLKLLKEVGFLDERIFYAPEDIDYCLRVSKSNKKIIYYPFFSVLHITQQITHKKLTSKIALSHLWGLTYYFFKHRYIHKPKI